jgi:hypothetical protein
MKRRCKKNMRCNVRLRTRRQLLVVLYRKFLVLDDTSDGSLGKKGSRLLKHCHLGLLVPAGCMDFCTSTFSRGVLFFQLSGLLTPRSALTVAFSYH